MYVSSSAGRGNLSDIPWISCAFSGQNFGVDVAYLFKSDMTGFYLALRVFYNGNFKLSPINSKYYVKAKADSIRDFLIKSNFNNSDFLFNINLASDNILSSIHESGTILAKYYDSLNIPSEKELINDLNFFIDLNELILENYHNDIDISNDEWLDTLSKTDVINSEMFYIIKNLLDYDDYTSTFEEISEKMKLFGFDNLNIFSTVVQNSLNVKRYLEKRKIPDLDNNDLFWMVFFNWDISKSHKLVLREDLAEIFKNKLEIIEENRMNYEIEKNNISFYNYLLKEDYYFDKELIENFLLSLKINPFIICVGNSGTGKTKLSQLFAKYLIKESLKNNTSDNCFDDESQSFLASVKVGKSAINKGWAIPREDSINLIPKMNCEESFPALIDGIPAKGKINFNVRFFYESDDEIKNHLKKLANEDPSQRITLKLEVPSEFTEDEAKRLERNNQDFNYKIIPIGANWTENRNIVGYYNVITDQYTSTPAYELIQDASANKKEPYFLILDEMNLSHVERYFADFLSAMESGEDIPLYGAEDLEIPPNLFIIGTVNVDETTYMFSPKVLDRANVLEFKTHSAKSYMNGNIDVEAPDGDILFLENPLSGSEIRESGIDELRKSFEGVTVDGEDFWTVLSSEIDKFQSVLSKSGFDFGFRVINEIVRFMAVAWKYEGSPKEFNNWTRYFDAQIKQKMLPKLHGSEKIIGDTLNELYEICLNSSIADEDLAKYPESYKKLEEMKFVLRKQRYVSFIN